MYEERKESKKIKGSSAISQVKVDYKASGEANENRCNILIGVASQRKN
jgi:hypothetical protein